MLVRDEAGPVWREDQKAVRETGVSLSGVTEARQAQTPVVIRQHTRATVNSASACPARNARVKLLIGARDVACHLIDAYRCATAVVAVASASSIAATVVSAVVLTTAVRPIVAVAALLLLLLPLLLQLLLLSVVLLLQMVVC